MPAPAAAASEAAAKLSIHAGASADNAGRRITADASNNAASTGDIRTCRMGVLRACECRKLPGIQRPAKATTGPPKAAANAAGDAVPSASSAARRPTADAGNSSAGTSGIRTGRIPAAPRRGAAASAKPSARAAHDSASNQAAGQTRTPDQGAGRLGPGPLASGRMHAPPGAQVIYLCSGCTF